MSAYHIEQVECIINDSRCFISVPLIAEAIPSESEQVTSNLWLGVSVRTYVFNHWLSVLRKGKPYSLGEHDFTYTFY